MKRYFSMTASLLAAIVLSAQVNTTIKVKKVKWDVTVRPNDSVLWIKKNNPVKILVTGGTNYTVNIKGGTIKRIKDDYTLNVFTEGAAILTVYEKLPGNKLKVRFTKLYQVKRIPDPIPYVCGVKNDSVIDKLQIINENIVTVVHPYYNVQLPVMGFDMIVTLAGKTDTLTSTNNHFTIDMRRRIYYITSGSIIYFDNVYCKMPNGEIEKIDPFEIFVTETNKYNVGFVKFGF